MKTKTQQIVDLFNQIVNDLSLIEHEEFEVHTKIRFDGESPSIWIDIFSKKGKSLYCFYIFFENKEVSDCKENLHNLIEALNTKSLESVGKFRESFGGSGSL